MAQLTTFGTSPITGSDYTVGLTADSMNVDPVTSVPYYDEAMAAQAAALAAQQAASQPQGPNWLVVAGLAGGAWWAWKQGLLTKLANKWGKGN